MTGPVVFIEGDESLLDRIQPLWEKLNERHRAVSLHFAGVYAANTFARRRAGLMRKLASGRVMYVVLAYMPSSGEAAGYCVGTASRDGEGEVESIFVDQPFRGRGVADQLMRKTLAWMDGCGVTRKRVEVVFGNEEVVSFYARYGFVPRSTILQQAGQDKQLGVCTLVEKKRDAYLCIDGCVQIWPDADFASIPSLGVTAYLLTAFDPYMDLKSALKEMSFWHRTVARYPRELRVALASGDIDDAYRQGQSALILGCQGLNFVSDDLWVLDVMQRLGLRVAQLTYNDRNMVADGCLEPGGAGLSGFGRRVVAQLARLGIVLDLSHVGERSSLEAMDASPDPAIISHANPRSVVSSPRNITDAQIRACAAKSGVIGLSPWGPLSWRRPDMGRPTLDDYLACMEYVIEMVGIDHIGIGTDHSIGTYSTTLHQELVQRYPSVFDDYGRLVEAHAGSPLRYVSGFDDLTKFQAFGGVLAARGYSDSDVRKVLGGNFLRVFAQVWDRRQGV